MDPKSKDFWWQENSSNVEDNISFLNKCTRGNHSMVSRRETGKMVEEKHSKFQVQCTGNYYKEI